MNVNKKGGLYIGHIADESSMGISKENLLKAFESTGFLFVDDRLHLGWYKHPEHPNMFVFRESEHKGYGWDCKDTPNINTWWNFSRMEVISLEEKDLLFDLDRRFREALYNGNEIVLDNKYYE